jgi:transposase-like protein
MLLPRHCPTPDCAPTDGATFFRRKGTFQRADASVVARFQCKECRRHFSEQTFRADYRWRRRDLDAHVHGLRKRGISVRAAARLLGVDRKTVRRREAAALSDRSG